MTEIDKYRGSTADVIRNVKRNEDRTFAESPEEYNSRMAKTKHPSEMFSFMTLIEPSDRPQS